VTASHVFPRARALVACAIALGLAGCATPVKNPKTGQGVALPVSQTTRRAVSCDGDTDWLGGGKTFGYFLKNPDHNCVKLQSGGVNPST